MSGWGGQGGSERRIEVFVKIQKNIFFFFFFWGGGGRWRGRVGGGQGGCERRIEVWENSQKFGGGGGGGQVGGRVGGGGVRVDVNAMLGVGGDVGYGGFEQFPAKSFF